MTILIALKTKVNSVTLVSDRRMLDYKQLNDECKLKMLLAKTRLHISSKNLDDKSAYFATMSQFVKKEPTTEFGEKVVKLERLLDNQSDAILPTGEETGPTYNVIVGFAGNFEVKKEFDANKPRTLSKVFERLAELIGEKEESMIRLLTNLTSSRLTNIGREASRNSEYNELTGYRDSLKLTDSEIRQMIDFIKQQGGLSTVLVAVIPNSNVSTEQQPSSFFANFLQRCAPQMSMLCESEIQQRSAARIFTVRARHDLPVMKLSQQTPFFSKENSMIEHQWAAVKGIAPPYLEEQCIGSSKLSVAEGDGNFVNLIVQGGLLHGFISTALNEHRSDFPPPSGTHGGEEGPPTYWINENVHGFHGTPDGCFKIENPPQPWYHYFQYLSNVLRRTLAFRFRVPFFTSIQKIRRLPKTD